jgi:hypothetical protein
MRSRVTRSTSGRWFKTREIVVRETPASRAMSSIVGFFGMPILTASPSTAPMQNVVSAPGIDSGIDHKEYALNAACCQAAILV